MIQQHLWALKEVESGNRTEGPAEHSNDRNRCDKFKEPRGLTILVRLYAHGRYTQSDCYFFCFCDFGGVDTDGGDAMLRMLVAMACGKRGASRIDRGTRLG